MNRIIAAVALALSLATSSAVVMAAPAKAEAARHERGDAAKKFPMKADEFRQQVAQRTVKARARMEKHLANKKVSEEKAKEVRAKFAAVQARVDAKVTEVCADGTVTLDEAKSVRTIAREAMPAHGKHAKKGKKLPTSAPGGPTGPPPPVHQTGGDGFAVGEAQGRRARHRQATRPGGGRPSQARPAARPAWAEAGRRSSSSSTGPPPVRRGRVRLTSGFESGQARHASGASPCRSSPTHPFPGGAILHGAILHA